MENPLKSLWGRMHVPQDDLTPFLKQNPRAHLVDRQQPLVALAPARPGQGEIRPACCHLPGLNPETAVLFPILRGQAARFCPFPSAFHTSCPWGHVRGRLEKHQCFVCRSLLTQDANRWQHFIIIAQSRDPSSVASGSSRRRLFGVTHVTAASPPINHAVVCDC